MKNLLLTTLCSVGLSACSMLLLSTMHPAHATSPAPLILKHIEISGTVMFEGKPVPNIQLEIPEDTLCYSSKSIMAVKTDQHGRYRFLLPQTHSVIAIAVNGFRHGEINKSYGVACLNDELWFEQDNEKKHYDIHLKAVSKEEQSCTTQGGRWNAQMGGDKQCILYHADELKPCFDGSQCLGKLCETFLGTKDAASTTPPLEGFCTGMTAIDGSSLFGSASIKQGNYYPSPEWKCPPPPQPNWLWFQQTTVAAPNCDP